MATIPLPIFNRRKMMPTQRSVAHVLTSDSSKGRRYVEICRAQYDKAGLDEDSAQELNEHPGFAAYLAEGIRRFSTKSPVFPIYLECEIGGKSKDQLLMELKAGNHEVSSWVKDIMSKDAWKSGERETVKFARVKTRDLGFTKNPTTHEIWARIQELGHSLCKPGDGPAIRLALKDQPRGDAFWVAMEQIADSGGGPGVFRVGRGGGGGSWLNADWVRPGRGWRLDSEVVFRLRK